MAYRVWLTFDDGPDPETTPTVLNVLRENDITATFFMVGNIAALNFVIARQVAAAGHFIGNHTYTHKVTRGLPAHAIRNEILDAEAVLKSLPTYQRWFRPPEGRFDLELEAVLFGLDFELVLWNVDTRDFESKDPEVWIPTAIEALKPFPEAVVVNHDIHGSTADHLQVFIDQIRSIGDVTFGSPADMPLLTSFRPHTPAPERSRDRRSARP